MKTDLSHLPKHKQAELKAIVAALVPKYAEVEMIIPINIEFGKVFPKATYEERIRFTLLKKAYVDARYKAEYKITKEDLEYLSERVKLLRSLTEQICKEKIADFTK